MLQISNNGMTDDTMWVGHISGIQTKIVDMRNEHLLSSIAMIERGVDSIGQIVPIWCLMKESLLRAEIVRRENLGMFNLVAETVSGWDD